MRSFTRPRVLGDSYSCCCSDQRKNHGPIVFPPNCGPSSKIMRPSHVGNILERTVPKVRLQCEFKLVVYFPTREDGVPAQYRIASGTASDLVYERYNSLLR